MKNKYSFTSAIISIILTSLLSVFSGCDKNHKKESLTSILPDNQQLLESEFHRFVEELKQIPEVERTNSLKVFLETNPINPVIEKNGLACFYYYGAASSVLINGDLHTGWTQPDKMNFIDCGNDNFFYKIYSLPMDSRIDYQLIVDDSVITDPRNPIVTPSGFGAHSQCSMPLFKIKSIRNYRADIQHGSIDSLLFESKLTNMPRRLLKIYKPTVYEKLSDLPVLYVNDGFKAIKYCNYINVLDNLIADKKIMPILVVFVDFIEGDQDYFLNKTNEYFTAFCKELVPLIDSRYKTSRTPKDRVLSGISAGGHISLLTSLKNPDVFLNAAGQSSSTTDELFEAVTSSSLNKPVQKEFKLYFDVGRFDLAQGGINNYSFLYANQILNEEMIKAGINHAFKVLNDGHQWANWRERIDEILVCFFGI